MVAFLDEPLDPLDGFVLGTAMFGRTPASLFGAVDAGRIARWTLPWAERLAPVIDQVQPDTLVCDFCLSGALIAGEATGAPTAALVHNCTIGWPLPVVPLPPPGSTRLRGPAGWVRDRLWAAAYQRVARREAAASVDAARTALRLPTLGTPTRTGHAGRPRARHGNTQLRASATATRAREGPLHRDHPRRQPICTLGAHARRVNKPVGSREPEHIASGPGTRDAQRSRGDRRIADSSSGHPGPDPHPRVVRHSRQRPVRDIRATRSGASARGSGGDAVRAEHDRQDLTAWSADGLSAGAR